MKKLYIILISSVILMLSAFKTNHYVKETKANNITEKIPFSGTYYWDFKLPGDIPQTSIFTFHPNYIDYEMKGKAYTNKYTQKLISYEPKEKRLITMGEGGESIKKDGVYFVMFFKDIKEKTITIYKHECKKNGLEEAKNFHYPKPDAKSDHGGWVVYTKK